MELLEPWSLCVLLSSGAMASCCAGLAACGDTHTNQGLEPQLGHWQERKTSGKDKPQDSCDALGFCVWEGGSSGFAVSLMSLGAGEAPKVNAE